MTTPDEASGTGTEPTVKSFNIRNIPPKLHHSWKVVAALHDTSMERLALIAIQKFCRSEIESLQGKSVEVESEEI